MRAIPDSHAFARAIRRRAVELAHAARASHVGSALSMADLLAVLYGEVLRVNPAMPSWPGRDRLLISKGHASSSVYAALQLSGFITDAELWTFGQNGSRLLTHVSHKVPGVELSTGSLGHALPVACGMALAARRAQARSRVFVILSDGELDEGSNWEAILFAGHHRLSNLTAIVDYNKIQSLGSVEGVLGLEPLRAKMEAFGWCAREIDGHDHDAIRESLSEPPARSRPTAVIAHTIKGKGVAFMENDLAWHYRSPDGEQLRRALELLGGDE